MTSSSCYSALASAPEQGWQVTRPLASNVSHAASASLGENMFVFGGQRTEVCDDNNQVGKLKMKTVFLNQQKIETIHVNPTGQPKSYQEFPDNIHS